METIFGWNSPEEVAAEIWKSSADNLLRGDLIFAVKNSGDIEKLIITSNFTTDKGKKVWTDFGVLTVTKGWTGLVPHVKVGYLEEVTLKDMKENKVDKEIIESLKTTLKKWKSIKNPC